MVRKMKGWRQGLYANTNFCYTSEKMLMCAVSLFVTGNYFRKVTICDLSHFFKKTQKTTKNGIYDRGIIT